MRHQKGMEWGNLKRPGSYILQRVSHVLWVGMGSSRKIGILVTCELPFLTTLVECVRIPVSCNGARRFDSTIFIMISQLCKAHNENRSSTMKT